MRICSPVSSITLPLYFALAACLFAANSLLHAAAVIVTSGVAVDRSPVAGVGVGPGGLFGFSGGPRVGCSFPQPRAKCHERRCLAMMLLEIDSASRIDVAASREKALRDADDREKDEHQRYGHEIDGNVTDPQKREDHARSHKDGQQEHERQKRDPPPLSRDNFPKFLTRQWRTTGFDILTAGHFF